MGLSPPTTSFSPEAMVAIRAGIVYAVNGRLFHTACGKVTTARSNFDPIWACPACVGASNLPAKEMKRRLEGR